MNYTRLYACGRPLLYKWTVGMSAVLCFIISRFRREVKVEDKEREWRSKACTSANAKRIKSIREFAHYQILVKLYGPKIDHIIRNPISS